MVVSTGFAVVRPHSLNAKYCSWALREYGFVEEIVACSTGVSYPAINAAQIGDFSLPLPPLAEQHAIAAFLDRETVRIDKLVEKNRLLIERLAEYRTAMIARAVTGGLDPSAPSSAQASSGSATSRSIGRCVDSSTLLGFALARALSVRTFRNSGNIPSLWQRHSRIHVFIHPLWRAPFDRKARRLVWRRQLCVWSLLGFRTRNCCRLREWCDANWLTYTLDFLALNRLSQSAAQPGLAVDKVGAVPSPLPPLTNSVPSPTTLTEKQSTSTRSHPELRPQSSASRSTEPRSSPRRLPARSTSENREQVP